MLMTEFEKWREEVQENTYENFLKFWITKYGHDRMPFSELAWQVKELQECMEGIIEDLNENVNELRQENKNE